MTELLLRMFVKNHKNTADGAVRASVGKLAGGTGIVCNVILFLGKLTAGLLSGSVAIIADAVNNLSDASSSVVTLLGFRLAQLPADKDHPYGHARYEYLSGLMVAILILIIGVELVQSSVGKILQPETVDFSALTIGILLVSVLVKLWMAGFFRKLGKHIDSLTLEATAVDSRNDVITTTAVLLGCLAGAVFDIDIDGYVGLAVAVFILYSGFHMLKETISPLLGKRADAVLIEKINALVLSHEKVLGVHDLLVHDYGPGRYFASIHVELSAEESPLDCHDIIDHIETEVRRELNVDMVIHYDPVVTGNEEWNEIKELLEKMAAELDERISMHDFRMMKENGKTKICFDLALPYELEQKQEKWQKQVEKMLQEKKPGCIVEIRFEGKL